MPLAMSPRVEPHTPSGSRRFCVVAGSVHLDKKVRVPDAVARTPSPRPSVSKTSRSFCRRAGLKEARKRSVNLGMVRIFVTDPLRACNGFAWRLVASPNQRTTRKSQDYCGSWAPMTDRDADLSLTFNQRVQGSSPCEPTNDFNR
jgi:hypothetical protein